MPNPPRTLLIVDDEETIHKALARTLRRESYELLHAYDSAEAAAVLAQRDDVVAVICDHYMPGTHGLDLLIEVRRRYPHLITILLTAQADLQLVMAALNDGHIHKFLTKPWEPAALRQTLADLIDNADALATSAVPVGDSGGAARLDAEMTPPRDTSTGAFIIDPADFA